MKKCTFLLAAALACAPTAHAQDSRVVTHEYANDQVVRVVAHVGVQTTVAFANDETIENVAVGDSETWQITPNKRASHLFIKPLNARSNTNMTVVTDRRTYLFDLVVSAAARPIYFLRFTYPGTVEQPTLAGAQAEERIEPRTLNFRWNKSGKSKLFPTQVYDDGHSTYLTWSAGTAIPAILIRNQRGEEGPANFAVREDSIVVDGVPTSLVLRLGKDRAILENRTPQGGSPAVATAGLAKIGER